MSVFKVGVKRTLKSVDMDEAIEETQIHSSSFSFILLCSECAIDKLNSLIEFTAGERENSNYFRILRARVSIKETVESTLF